MTQAYAVKGRRKASQPYHYTQSGLDDVYLLNGYKSQETPYGKGVRIENAEQLHEAIATWLCLNKAFLNGKEFRFLRKLMDLTQAEVATFLKCDAQSIARWEKGQTEINGAADTLMRVLYMQSRKMETDAAELIKRVAELNGRLDDKQVFEETSDGWKAAA